MKVWVTQTGMRYHWLYKQTGKGRGRWFQMSEVEDEEEGMLVCLALPCKICLKKQKE